VRADYSIIKDFDDFNVKYHYKIKGLLSNLPEEYESDYFLYSLGLPITELESLKKLPLSILIKTMAFKKFDAWVQEQLQEEIKKNNA
jgi:hypothetical protein